MFGNTTAMEQGEGVEGPIHKNIHDGNLVECGTLQSMLSIPSPPSGGWS